ncbi:hypothetical protein ACTFIY_010471 [Dictyostelium cf. discoideum]
MPFLHLFTPYTNADNTKLILRVNESRLRLFTRQLLAEFFGTLFVVYIVSGSTLAANFAVSDPIVRVCLVCLIQGMAFAAIIWSISGISGCQLNPAVTVGCVTTGRMGIFNGIAFIIFQCVGALVGAGMMKASLPTFYERDLSATTLATGINVARGFCLEMVTTSFLVFVVLGVAVYNEWDPKISRVAPLAIGCAVIAGVGFLNLFTGGSLNPARSFGPAVFSDTWHRHYIYWFGPISGGIIAGLLWRIFLSEKVLLIDRPYTDFHRSTYGTATK